MTEKEIYRSLKRDFFVKELEAKGIDCTGLSLEDVLKLAEENNVAAIKDMNSEDIDTINNSPEEFRENDNTMNIAINSVDECYKLLYDKLSSDEHIIPVDKYTLKQLINRAKEVDIELYNKAYSLYPGVINDNTYDSGDSFMKEYAKEMDNEISKGIEEIETSKAYLENLLKSNGIDTTDLSYTYMLDLAAKLQKDLEPKEEETKDVDETSNEKHIWDDSEISKDYKEESSETLMIKIPEKEEKHKCTCGECDCDKDKPQEEQLTRRQKILKGFLVKELSAIEAINQEWIKSAYYLDIINIANAFPHIMKKWETSLEFEEYKKVTEEAINKVIDFVGGRQDDMLNDVVESKLDEAIHGDVKSLNVLENILEKSTNPTALLLNKSFMQGFLYSKTDLGIIRLNNMSYSELLDECKKFVGFKNSLENRFDFIEDPEWINTLKDYLEPSHKEDEMSITFQGETTVVPYGNILYNMICEVLWYQTIANLKLEYLGDVNILAHAVLGAIKNPIMVDTNSHDVDIVKEVIEALSLKFKIKDSSQPNKSDNAEVNLTLEEVAAGVRIKPDKNKDNTVAGISQYSTKELSDELFTRGGIEPYWLGPNSTYTLDISNPEDSVHTNMYFNGAGPLWIIFNYD